MAPPPRLSFSALFFNGSNDGEGDISTVLDWRRGESIFMQLVLVSYSYSPIFPNCRTRDDKLPNSLP
jgi:hypothetical protein